MLECSAEHRGTCPLLTDHVPKCFVETVPQVFACHQRCKWEKLWHSFFSQLWVQRQLLLHIFFQVNPCVRYNRAVKWNSLFLACFAALRFKNESESWDVWNMTSHPRYIQGLYGQTSFWDSGRQDIPLGSMISSAYSPEQNINNATAFIGLNCKRIDQIKLMAHAMTVRNFSMSNSS